MKHSISILGAILLVTMCLTVSPALAYIGPGLGVVAIWSLLGPIAGVIALVLLIAYFPARYYYKKHKHKKAEALKDSEVGENSSAVEPVSTSDSDKTDKI